MSSRLRHLTAALLLLAACAQEDEPQRVEGAASTTQAGAIGKAVTGPVRITNDFSGTVASLGGGRFVVVDGLHGAPGNRRLVVTLVADDGAMRQLDGPAGLALLGVTAAVAGRDLVVAGTGCPEPDENVLQSNEFNFWREVCGSGPARIDVLSLDTGEWREALADGHRADLRVTAASDDAALVARVGSGGGPTTYHSLSLDEHDPLELGPAIEIPKGISAACRTPGGIAVASTPADADLAPEPRPLHELGASVSLLRDGVAVPVTIPPTEAKARFLRFDGCLPDGGFVANPSTPIDDAFVILRIDDVGTATWDRVRLPAPSVEMPAAVTSSEDGFVLWTSTATKPDHDMEDIGFQGWLLHDGTWVRTLHRMGVDHPREVVVSGTRIAIADGDVVQFG